MNQIRLYLLLTTVLCSCGDTSHPSSNHPTKARQEVPDATQTAPTTAVAVGTEAAEPSGDTLRASLTKAIPVTLRARLDSLHSTVICAVQTREAGTLTAGIAPERGAGNIRFSQIYLPDGHTDGPFGRSLTYKLTRPGTYRLRISPSQMANDPYRGQFTVTLQLN